MTPPHVTRRTVLAGAAVLGGVGAVGALAACSDETPSAPSGSTGAEPATVEAAQVPVGSGTIVAAQQLVVTQPTAGQFRAFSAVCPHQGCLVARVEGTTIMCTCHNSSFSAEDGSVLSGPASRALTKRTVSVEGGTLTIA